MKSKKINRRHMGALLLCLGPLALAADDPLNLEQKTVFRQGYPQFLAFRGEMRRPSHRNYDTWCESVNGASGVIRKFVREELPKLYLESAEWADRYVRENPEILLMLHLNGESRQVLDYPDVHKRYFPGHWVYEPGTFLTEPVSPQDVTLEVEDARPFKMKGYVDREKDGSKKWFPHHLILVPLNLKGERLWNESEFAILEGVDYDRNALTVKRGQLFSKKNSFRSQNTYVAPLAGGVWGGQPMWFYNLSSACPQDGEGKTAGDRFVEEIAEWFSSDGPLARFNGICFDVNYWKVRDESWDVNNDGIADMGNLDGINVWREGDWLFLQSLRETLGDNRLITCDGQHDENQQAVGVLDGIESEGLVQHNDGFRGFSRTINTHLYWQQTNTRKHDFRYIVLKLMNEQDETRGDQLRRFATGTASCLEAFVTGSSAPFLPAGFDQPGSLGFPAGKLIRPAQAAPNLLNERLADQLHANNCSIRKKNEVIQISPDHADNPLKPMTVVLKDLDVPPGDLTLFVTMEALEPLEGFSAEDRVPRRVQAEFSKLPDYGEGRRVNEFYSDLYGYIGTHGPSTMSFYLRRPGCGADKMDVTFHIGGRGEVALHALSAHSAPDTLVRAFDHGIVAVNPALEPVTLPLAKLLPEVSGLPESIKIPALDSTWLPRP